MKRTCKVQRACQDAQPTSRPFCPGRLGAFWGGGSQIGRFKELKHADADLRKVGVMHLHELAASDSGKLATALHYRPEEAEVLIKLAKQLLSTLGSR